jgi:hypothetical protein
MLSHIQPSALIGLVAGRAGHALAFGGILAMFKSLLGILKVGGGPGNPRFLAEEGPVPKAATLVEPCGTGRPLAIDDLRFSYRIGRRATPNPAS